MGVCELPQYEFELLSFKDQLLLELAGSSIIPLVELWPQEGLMLQALLGGNA